MNTLTKSNDAQLARKKDLLENNKSINRSLISDVEKIERQLRNIGVETKPRFTISPALGGSLPTLHFSKCVSALEP